MYPGINGLSLLEKITASLPGVVFTCFQRPDNSNVVTYVSSGCQEVFELEPEIVQANFLVLLNLIHSEDIQNFTESFLVSSDTLSPLHWEGRIVTASNKYKWIQVNSYPSKQASGDILWEGFVMDITTRKLAEENLRVSEGRYKAILNAIPDLIFRINADGQYIDFKGEGANITIPREQIVGKNLWDLLPHDIANSSYAAIHKALTSRSVQTCEYKLSTPIGLRDYEARVVVSGHEEILAIVRDITERKQAEAQLHTSISRNRLLAETLGRIRRSLDLDEILQTTVTEVRKFLQADRVFIALNENNAQCKVLAESVNPCYPAVLDWKDDSPDECLFNELKTSLLINNVRVVEDITQIEVSPRLKTLYHKFHTQAALAVPIILGDELFGVLIANQCSTPRHWQPVEIDLLQQISEQLAIAIQQAKLYQELAQLNFNLEGQVEERTVQLQQKVQEIQEISRIKDVVLDTVSHDLRTSVMGNLMVLNNLLKAEREIPCSIIERMIQGNERQLGMINSLLEINSGDAKDMIMHQELVDFNTLIEAILQDSTSLLTRYQAQLNTQLNTHSKKIARKNSVLVKADQELLRKVFVSLLTYSCHNNPPGLNFSIKAKMDGDKIRCMIQDDGVGMSKSECDSFFDLHVRDPQNRLSTSLSLKLYMCRQIITAHGGEIGVTSNRKQGVTYWFTLPIEQKKIL